MLTLASFFHRTYFDQRWKAAIDPQQVEVEASVVIPTDICMLLIRKFMHYAAWSTINYHGHYRLFCIFCASVTCRNLRFLSVVIFHFFLLTAHALKWGDYLCSFAFFMPLFEFDNPFSKTGYSVSGKLVDKLITTHQSIPSSLNRHPNLIEFSVPTIIRVFRYSCIYLIRSRVVRRTV